MNIGDRIKQARLNIGYSAEQVAAFLQVSPATVYRYENGDISKLPSKFIKPLAEYLCVTPEYLMGWSDESAPVQDLPKNDEIRLLIRGLNKLSPDQLEQAKNVMKAMFVQYADYFDTKENDNDT